MPCLLLESDNVPRETTHGSIDECHDPRPFSSVILDFSRQELKEKLPRRRMLMISYGNREELGSRV